MSYPFLAQEELLASELNTELRRVIDVAQNAGETIDGETLPVAVYIKKSDNKVYACDGDALDALVFIGFAITNGTDGNSISVQISGVVSGFTGLNIGSKYYVQDDKTIGTDLGTYMVLVGVAISATEILIENKPTEFVSYETDTLQTSADTERTGAVSSTPVKVKEITINKSGKYRTKFDLKQNITGGGATSYARIYKNGVAFGTQRSNTNDSYATHSEDLAFNDGDKCQLYCWGDNNAFGRVPVVRNFRLYFDYKVPTNITDPSVDID